MSKFDRQCRICGKAVGGQRGEYVHTYLRHKDHPKYERLIQELKPNIVPWNKGKTYKQTRGSGPVSTLPAVTLAPLANDSGVSAEDLILALEVKRDTLSSVIDDLKRMIAKA